MSFDVPDACTLPTAERPVRLAEFNDVFATVRRVDLVSATRARLHLTGPAGLADRVRDLAARETACCSFFTFTTTAQPATDGEAVVLDIEVPAAHAEVLASLTQRATAVSSRGDVMNGGLPEIADLAARSGVPMARLRRYAEAGLLLPARRDGDRPGYPPAEVNTVRMLAGAEDLGFNAATVGDLAAASRDGTCASTQQRLAAAVTARLAEVQADIVVRNRQAVEAGPGTPGWATEMAGSASSSEEAARLQAVAAALTAAAHDGLCGDDCGCTTALAAAGASYQFPHDPASGEAALACDLVADGGDVHHRIGVWQQVLARVEGRDPLPDAPDGVALRFPFDVDLAGTLGRLAAAEYRCCSFGSYTLVVDGTGLRLEIRMPVDAARTLAAVVGRPDLPTHRADAR